MKKIHYKHCEEKITCKNRENIQKALDEHYKVCAKYVKETNSNEVI